mgnify:CR=1 FL=1
MHRKNCMSLTNEEFKITVVDSIKKEKYTMQKEQVPQ